MLARLIIGYYLLLVYLSGFTSCQTCPVECKCRNHEVRCMIPRGTNFSFANFASLRNSSHLYSRLTLSNSHLRHLSLSKALLYLRHVTHIDLSRNNISTISDIDLSSDINIVIRVDLNYNRIQRIDLCDSATQFIRKVKYVNLHHNDIREFIVKCKLESQALKWQVLDMSHNQLKRLYLTELLNDAPDLKFLNVSANKMKEITSNTFHSKLNLLDLSNNEINHLSFRKAIISLRKLIISDNRQLKYINPSGIENVRYLTLRNCRSIRGIDADATMRNLTKLDMTGCSGVGNLDLSLYFKLKEIHVSFTNISTLLPPISWNTQESGLLDIRNTQNWNCSCNIAWISNFSRPKTATCGSPSSLIGKRIPRTLPSCITPQILNFTNLSRYGLGEKAMLECRVGGDPHPVIIWNTPSNTPHIYRRLTSKRYFTSAETQGSLFHAQHPWHGSHLYKYELERDKKRYYYVLTDGSLYIDYVTRKDAGLYTCTVLSPLGNQSMTMELRLNYDIIRAVRWHSQIVGMVCAGCMLGIGFTICIIRLIKRRCRTEERKKRNKTLKIILENLESYRVDKFDKLRAYKSNKMDQLRDNYNGQVLRIKDSCYTHMLNMQEHYNRRIAKIRDNYETKIDRLRDSYSGQMMKIKDYRSHQVERIRDNYNQQILRIREYASVQLMRLREQYRMQQQFFVKLLETLNLENCMAVDVDELDDVMARNAEDLEASDADDDDVHGQFTARVLDPQSILAHMGSVNVSDLESQFPLHSLPSLPGLPDIESFVRPDFGDCIDVDDAQDVEMSPVRSLSPVSEDYLTADSEYDSTHHPMNSSPDNCSMSMSNDDVDVIVHDRDRQLSRVRVLEESV